MAVSPDLDSVPHQPWNSQNYGSQSQDPSSPHLGGRKQEWRTSADTGYATNKSQESYYQSQPKSQDNFRASNGSAAHTDSPYASNSDAGRDGEGGGGGRVVPLLTSQFQQRGKTLGDIASSNPNSSPSSSVLSISTGHDHHQFNGRKEDGSIHEGKSTHKNIPPSLYDHSVSFSPQVHDGYSPVSTHSPYPLKGALGSEHSPVGRGYDPYHGRTYGGYPMPSLEEGGEAYNKQQFTDKFRHRSGDHNNHHHKLGGHYGTPPQGTPTIGGVMGGRPAYPDYYGDHRGGQRRFNHTHDPSFLSPGHHSRPRPHMGHPGMDDDYNSQVAMEMFLSQPSANYYGYERYGSPGGHHMIGGGASG